MAKLLTISQIKGKMAKLLTISQIKGKMAKMAIKV
jgi:hypothetical protein